FFFSSRRRHTRCLSDWSSDVCSSDLPSGFDVHRHRADTASGISRPPMKCFRCSNDIADTARFCSNCGTQVSDPQEATMLVPPERSEERRVGKECRWRGVRKEAEQKNT